MAAAATESISRDIYHATNACRGSLQNCQSIDALMSGGWAENRLADFNLWASGVGASAATQASLDWRLHYQPKTRIVLASLLVTLKEFVEQCKDLGLRSDYGEQITTAPVGDEESTALRVNSWSSEVDKNDAVVPEAASVWFDALDSDSVEDESSDDSSSMSAEDAGADTTTPINEAMRHTEDILDQLIRLGLAIRKSGTGSRLRKADNSFKQDDHKDLQKHLSLLLVADATRQHDNHGKDTQERIIDPDKSYDELSPEQKHIITANLRRRHRFLYARRHQRKLEEPRDINIMQGAKRTTQPTATPKSATPSQAPQSVIKTSTVKLDSDNAAREAAMTVTIASAAEGDVLKAVATPSQAASRVSVTTARMSYPSPPPVQEGMRSFKCPCCFQTLPLMFRERSRWRKHLAEDLCPYTCPFNDCPEAAVLYITRDTWKSHINKTHGASQYWECLPCMGVETPETFLSAEEFVAHTRTRHQDTIAEAQITALQELCCKTVPPTIPHCPLCFGVQQESGPVDPESLLDHIGDCIHDFSLKALPWAESTEGEEFMQAPLVDEQVSKWLEDMKWPDAKEESLVLKFLSFETQPPASDTLFVISEYFAERSENSSRVEREAPPWDPDLPEPNFSSNYSPSPSDHDHAPGSPDNLIQVERDIDIVTTRRPTTEQDDTGRSPQRRADPISRLSSDGTGDPASPYSRDNISTHNSSQVSVFNQADGIEESALESENPGTLRDKATLAAKYAEQGRWGEAETLQLQVVESQKATLGPDHEATLRSMANLASTYIKQHRWEEAEKLQVHLLETHRATLGPDHEATLRNMANLVATYEEQGRWDEAGRLQVHILETHKITLGPDHAGTLRNMADLAAIFMAQSRWDEAEKLQLHVMEAHKSTFGPDHVATLLSMTNLASMYRRQGRLDEAEKLQLQVMETHKAILGSGHPDTARSMRSLAATYMKQGRLDQAKELEEQAKEILGTGYRTREADRFPRIQVTEDKNFEPDEGSKAKDIFAHHSNDRQAPEMLNLAGDYSERPDSTPPDNLPVLLNGFSIQSRNGDFHFVEATPDIGSHLNWISISQIERFELERRPHAARQNLTTIAGEFRATEDVEVHWSFNGRRGVDSFYVLPPDSAVSLVVGNDLMGKLSHATLGSNAPARTSNLEESELESTSGIMNNPSDVYQRQVVTDRRGGINVRSSCVDIVHGRLGPKEERFATLIVLRFNFVPGKRGRRAKAASIKITFDGRERQKNVPEVISIAPYGRWILTPPGLDQVASQASLERGSAHGSTSYRNKPQTRGVQVLGSIMAGERVFTKPDSASWVLKEDATTKTGLPTDVWVAILLAREDGGVFQFKLNVEAELDVLSSFNSIFHRTVVDDPVLLDPTMQPTNKLRKYDPDSLAAIDLTDLISMASNGGTLHPSES